MTELQASLIAIGGAILCGVVSYNKWQEYRAKKNVERAFSTDHEDVLMKSEPQLADEAASNEHLPGHRASGSKADMQADMRTDGVSSGPRQEPAIHVGQDLQVAPHEQASDEDQSDVLIRTESSRNSIVDPLIDLSIPLMLEGPLWGEKILPVIQGLRHVGNKPVHYIGLNDNGNWEAVAHGSLYMALQAGVQLANRGSALNEIEYSEMLMQLRQIADSLNAELDVPNMTRVMSAARELHQFVLEYDAQLSINIRANSAPWAIATLLSALTRQGFDRRPDGRLVMPDGDNGMLFSLSTNSTAAEETTSRLTLLLNMPCVAPSRDGFGAMTACAKSLATRLGGTIVDDADQPLSADSMAEIAAQVRDFYEQMEVAEVPAGSVRALRLFS